MVYVITEGQYRDYHIERIYDDYGAAWRYYNSLKEQRGYYPTAKRSVAHEAND